MQACGDHRKGIINYHLDTNGLNAHNSCGYRVSPVMAQLIAACWSEA
jgi:hypothetical protein